jgi:hypothetical protein
MIMVHTWSGSIWQCLHSAPTNLSTYGLNNVVSESLFFWYNSSDSLYHRLNVMAATYRKLKFTINQYISLCSSM